MPSTFRHTPRSRRWWFPGSRACVPLPGQTLDLVAGGPARYGDGLDVRSHHQNDDVHHKNVLGGERPRFGSRWVTVEGRLPRHANQPGVAWQGEQGFPSGKVCAVGPPRKHHGDDRQKPRQDDDGGQDAERPANGHPRRYVVQLSIHTCTCPQESAVRVARPLDGHARRYLTFVQGSSKPGGAKIENDVRNNSRPSAILQLAGHRLQ